MRASQNKSATGKSPAPSNENNDSMMAEINKNIRFFNDTIDESYVEPCKKEEVNQTFNMANMSFSFAVDKPVEME